ncbi:hypothetical protein ON010_g4843 [Phytophthora cinnamomi]|nr:hypothetical protein ON010_g4843 [Phytophthora cinnamomi]
MIKEKGLSFVSHTEMATEKVAKPYELAEELVDERPEIKTGKDEDMDKTLSIPDLKAKLILTAYYKKLAENDIKIAVRLSPIVNSDKGVKVHPMYYLEADKEAIRSSRAAVKTTKADYSVKLRKYQMAEAQAHVSGRGGLKGRELQGAGVPSLQGVERKGRT